MNLTHVLAFVAALLTACSATLTSMAGEFNRVLSIGDTAPAWQELIATDGTNSSLGDYSDAKAVVLVFTCNSCPYAVDVEDRLIALTNQWKDQGVAVIAINANDTKEDSLEAMKERADEKAFPFVYLKDESQEVAKSYGATRTPEFFVLDQDRKVRYMGSFDDSPDGKSVEKRYVHGAVTSLLKNEDPAVSETVPIGCNIRYARTRRTRP